MHDFPLVPVLPGPAVDSSKNRSFISDISLTRRKEILWHMRKNQAKMPEQRGGTF
ncbi:MAG: hypothetical protein ACYS3N_18010 [Planctomycetota bacterium]|jgi:hypothetical protein